MMLHSFAKVGSIILLVLLSAAEAPARANDACADANDVTAGSYLGSTIGATVDGDATCSDPSPDVWFRFTAPASGTLYVNTCGSNDLPGEDAGIDTILSVHFACPTGGNPRELPGACNDDWAFGNAPLACEGIDLGLDLDSALSVPITGGEGYLIRVSRFPGTPDGEFLLNLAPEFAGAGYVPDGGPIAGSPLRVEQLSGGSLRFRWAASCQASDVDYAIYAGTLGSFTTHQPLTCTTGGDLFRDEPLPPGSHYYLVVPHNGIHEGSYGFATDASGAPVERTPATLPCYVRRVAGCP